MQSLRIIALRADKGIRLIFLAKTFFEKPVSTAIIVQKIAELFTFVIKAWNFAWLLLATLQTISDMDARVVKPWTWDLSMFWNCQHENEAEDQIALEWTSENKN